MNTRSIRLILGVLGLVVLVSCSRPSEGSPKPAPTSDPGIETTDQKPPSSDATDPGDDELPFAGAPKVDNPLSTTEFQQDPCQSLTSTQAQEPNVNSPGEPYEGALGSACKWQSKANRLAHVDVRF